MISFSFRLLFNYGSRKVVIVPITGPKNKDIKEWFPKKGRGKKSNINVIKPYCLVKLSILSSIS